MDTITIAILVSVISSALSSYITYRLTKRQDIFRMKNELLFKRITDSMENLIRGINTTIHYTSDIINIIKENHPGKKLIKWTDALNSKCNKTMKDYQPMISEIRTQSSVLSVYLTLYRQIIDPELLKFFKIVHEFETLDPSTEFDIEKAEARLSELYVIKRHIEISMIDLMAKYAGL